MKRKHTGGGDDLVVKKMVLVPPDKVIPEYRLKHKAYRPPFQPDRNQLSVLDEEMRNILGDKGIASTDDRLKRYEQAFDRFLTFFRKVRSRFPSAAPPTRPPLPPPLPPQRDTENAQDRDLQQKRQLQFMGLSHERPAVIRRAAHLLDRLTQSGLSWDAQGRVTYPDGTDPDSNIADLVHEVVSGQKASKHAPEGVDKFYGYLDKINVPNLVLGTTAKRAWFQQLKVARRLARDARTAAEKDYGSDLDSDADDDEDVDEDEDKDSPDFSILSDEEDEDSPDSRALISRDAFNKMASEVYQSKE